VTSKIDSLYLTKRDEKARLFDGNRCPEQPSYHRGFRQLRGVQGAKRGKTLPRGGGAPPLGLVCLTSPFEKCTATLPSENSWLSVPLGYCTSVRFSNLLSSFPPASLVTCSSRAIEAHHSVLQLATYVEVPAFPLLWTHAHSLECLPSNWPLIG